MRLIDTYGIDDFFKPLHKTKSVQAATMTLRPGQSSGERVEDEHPDSEQWLYVVSGTGRTVVGEYDLVLSPGSLLLIERREPHRITSTGSEPLVTINFYAPPAY